MKKITSFLQRRVLISMLFLGLSMLGYISYKQLSLELLPYIELPNLLVQISSVRDMDPEYLEREALIPLESSVGTLESVEKIESFAGRRSGVIYVTYESTTNMKYAFLKLQEKIDAAKTALSDDFIVQVIKIDTQDLTNMFMNLQVRGSGGVDRIRTIIDKEIKQEFESIDGIANVEVFGGRLSAVNIVLDNEKSEAYGITPARVRSLIAQYRQSTTFIGHVKNHQLKNAVNLVAEYTHISDLENIVVDATRGILLRDIADIYFDTQEETSISRVNGKEAVTIQLVRDTEINLINLAHETRDVIEKLNKKLEYQDIEIVVQQDSAEILEKNLDLIYNLALWGGILAVIILWYFMRNLRLVSVIAITIPVSVLTAFNFFYAYDISLNSLTLVGIALAIGMLLDNSVVVLENIYRIATREKDYLKAAVDGTKQMARSVSAATLTTIAVFLPFVFADEYLIRVVGFQIGVSIISTLLISLFAALVLIPMAAYYFLSHGGQSANTIQFSLTAGNVLPFYNLILKTMLRFPARTVVITVAAFVITVASALFYGLTESGDVELEDFNLYVTMSEGATLESTDLAVQDLENKFLEIEELQDVVSQIYEQEAILTLKLKEDYKDIADRDLAEIKEFIGDIAHNYRTADVSFDQPSNSERFRGSGRGDGGGAMGGMGGGLMSALGLSSSGGKVIITGRDFDMMRIVAEDIEGTLDDLSSIDNIRNNATRKRPELHLLFDHEQLSRLGIPLTSIASELASFQREVSTGMQFKDAENEYDIVIRNAQLEEKKRSDLEQLNIPSETSAVYPLSEISTFVVSEGSAGINRVNQERRIELNYNYVFEVNQSSTLLDAARLEVEDAVQSLAIPAGIAVQIEHEDVDLSDFKFLFVVAFLLIFMILASVFESLLKPFIIMFTIPLAAIGSLWAIIFSGNSIANINVLIGLLILLGIVVNNGIILIDYIQQLRRKKMRQGRAVILAGQARLRPIIITALTTIVAMIPLALGEEQYVTRIAAPFAITVIGGLSLSTILTLVFIPTVYSGLENGLEWFRSLKLQLKLLQIILFIAGAVWIYFYIESWLWQFAVLFTLLLAIPGLTYFVTHSLRQAQADYISPDEPITIRINNVYKLYDQAGRFRSEWQRKKDRIKQEKQASVKNGFIKNIWKFILWGFLLYFVYMYLDSGFWIVVLMHPFYFITRHIGNIFLDGKKSEKSKINRVLAGFIQWGVPVVNIAFIFFIINSPTAAVFMAIIWYMMLFIHRAGARLTAKVVNINRISGRLSGIIKIFYRFVALVPLIGQRKKPFKALTAVSLKIESGMFGLLGPNGAGKTTLMRIICGVLDQSYGTISINGFDVVEHREELQGLIGYLPQDFGMYENLTAQEFLNYQAILKNILDRKEREERIDYVLGAVHLQESRDKKIGSFSGGMKQRVGIAQTLLHLPRILVVDEPTAGLDPRERIRFRNLLVELSRERVVIFSTHVIEDIASSCDRVAILNKGELCYLGVPQQMANEARGKVWQYTITEKEFEKIEDKYNVVHHTRMDDGGIRIRVLADKKPFADALEVHPTLEDAYLWILKAPAREVLD